MIKDIEILKWNDGIRELTYQNDIEFSIMPIYDNGKLINNQINNQMYPNLFYPSINIDVRRKNEYDLGIKGGLFIETLEQKKPISYSIFYKYNFSLNEDLSDKFENILSILSLKPFNDFKMISNQTLKDVKTSDITLEKSDHIINGIKYIRYSFDGTLPIYDIIKNFSNIDYAKKFTLLKFKIGDIICINENKSDDYLILDYHNYEYLKVIKIDNITPEVIEYDEILYIPITDITFSRNDRINNIIGA